MPAKTKITASAYPEALGKGKDGVERPYEELLPELLEQHCPAMAEPMRSKVLDALRPFLAEAFREHQAQDAISGRKDYKAIEWDLLRTLKSVGRAGEDAALTLDVALKVKMGIEQGMFELVRQLWLLTKDAQRELPDARKEASIVHALVFTMLAIYEEHCEPVGISATGPFVEFITSLNKVLPPELRQTGALGNRVKKAVEEIKRPA